MCRWTVLPKGSGNARTCKRFAKLLRKDPYMGPHIKRMVVRTSSVTVYLEPTVDLLASIIKAAEDEVIDVPGQMGLFSASDASRAKV